MINIFFAPLLWEFIFICTYTKCNLGELTLLEFSGTEVFNTVFAMLRQFVKFRAAIDDRHLTEEKNYRNKGQCVQVATTN